jgi:hypothetical protein
MPASSSKASAVKRNENDLLTRSHYNISTEEFITASLSNVTSVTEPNTINSVKS